MRICSAGFQLDVLRKTIRGSGFVSTVPKVVIAAWLVAGAASVASGRPTTQPAGALAVWPYSDFTQAFPAAAMTRPAKVAAIDDEQDGDDDQDNPDDPNDTLAAAGGFSWGAAEASPRSSQAERERQPRFEAFTNQVVLAP
jgi:hypothetical protein